MADILMLDDETGGIISSVAKTLLWEKHQVTVESDPAAAQRFIACHKQVWLVADVMMPGENGIDWASGLGALLQKLRMAFFLTAGDPTDNERNTVDKLGRPSQFLYKSTGHQKVAADILHEIKKAEADSATGALLTVGPFSLDRQQYFFYAEGKTIGLGGKELRIMELFMRHPGNVHAKNAIIDMLYDASVPLTGTIEKHISNIRKKLGPMGKKIETVNKLGYRLVV